MIKLDFQNSRNNISQNFDEFSDFWKNVTVINFAEIYTNRSVSDEIFMEFNFVGIAKNYRK